MWSTYFTESLWQYTINTQFKAIKADIFSFFNYDHLIYLKTCIKWSGKWRCFLFYIFLTPAVNPGCIPME
jgi:hypothetical protein